MPSGNTVAGPTRYYHTVDLIAFDGEPEPSIRVSYFRHLATGQLRFAGQTSICTALSSWPPIVDAISAFLESKP